MQNWDEIRTAYFVAKMGTVSGAADAIGVHHATVIRHIDALEARLGVKLFQRHARGYTPTEAGQDLARVAQSMEDAFTQMAARVKGQEDALRGEVIITGLRGLSFLLTPILARFSLSQPDVLLRYLASDRAFRLEYGEAHVAIRAGTAPEDPDYVVQEFLTERFALVAHQTYLANRPFENKPETWANHRFICYDDPLSRAPYSQWMRAEVPHDAIKFQSTEIEVLTSAIQEGVGLGFIPVSQLPKLPGLKIALPPRPEWDVTFWLVTHVDMHRAYKVQEILKHLKSEAEGLKTI